MWKPASSIACSVWRLTLQPAPSSLRQIGFSRSCAVRQKRLLSYRTCSINMKVPPGFRSRLTSPSAAKASSTWQNTHALTTLSNPWSPYGISSAAACRSSTFLRPSSCTFRLQRTHPRRYRHEEPSRRSHIQLAPHTPRPLSGAERLSTEVMRLAVKRLEWASRPLFARRLRQKLERQPL